MRYLLSTELFGVVLFVFVTGFPPFDDATEVDLTMHMLQHVLIVFSGILISYPHLGRSMTKKQERRWLAAAAFLLSAAIVVFWHLPGPWDDAVLNPGVHLFEHFSFLTVGLLAGSWLMLLSDSGKIGALLGAFFGHMGYAVALIAPWGYQVYPLYALSNQVVLGWVLLLTGPTLMIGVAYVIARNPSWLGGYAGPGSPEPRRRQTILNRVGVPRWTAPAMTIVLVAVLIAYFAAAAYAAGAAGPAAGGSTVFISENPVSWQYSPQTIKVVVGVNSTVTWVSRSIAYDTVTSRDGLFASGAIPPGGMYSFTFTSPGVYDYYCLYHPWMTGSVVVQAAG